MLASFLPPSFLRTYSLSTSSLGCNVLCLVISFLVLSSICLSSSLVHLRKDPEYLTRSTAQVFIPLISSFLFLRYSFCFSFALVWWYYYYYYYFLGFIYQLENINDSLLLTKLIIISMASVVNDGLISVWIGTESLCHSLSLPLSLCFFRYSPFF